MTRKELEDIVGGLSKPSKMPCHGWSIPARACITGAKLAKIPGTVCSKCYALKGRYVFSNVQDALERRLEALSDPRWVDAMSELINLVETPPKGSGYFRFFDSGDLQDIKHLGMIVDVALRAPRVKFWVPTREVKIVSDWLKENKEFPKNLCVRISANKIDSDPPSCLGLPTSTVASRAETCPAPKQGNVCGDCRRCWNPKVRNVSYKKH